MSYSLIHGAAEDHLEEVAPELIITDSSKSMLPWLMAYAETHDVIVVNAYSRRWLVGDGTGAKQWLYYAAVIETFPGLSVCDPFMGWGAVGVAAVRAGRDFVGIEIMRSRYEAAGRAIAAAVEDAEASRDRERLLAADQEKGAV